MAKHLASSHIVLLTVSVSLAIFMNVLDTSIANVSIPAISGDLGVSTNQGTWVITSFAVSTAIMLPLTGWLARRFGEVKLFVISIALFTLASMFCGFSFNLPMLLFFRVLQGMFAGPMIPLSQSLLLANYPEDKKGIAMALWAMVAVVAPVLGPIIGGWITDNYNWPWIFYINLPVGAFSAYISWYLLADQETLKIKQRIDIIGLVLLVIGIGSLQILLDKGNDLDWFNSPTIITLTIIVVVCLSFLILWELQIADPIVDLYLFARRNFAVGTIAIALGYMVFFGNVVIFPLWLQTQLNYTATWAGLATAPIGILSIFLSPVVGRYMHKTDLRIIISISFLIFAAVAFWTSHFDLTVSFVDLIEPRLVQGIGIACFFTPLITIVLSGMPGKDVASAAGLTNFLRILGGSFGTSLSVNLWQHREQLHHALLAGNITLYNQNSVNAVANIQKTLHLSLPATYNQIDLMITNQAYMLSTINFFWLSGWIFFLLTFFVWLAKPPFVASGGYVAGD